jgi:hypothetical protein
LETYRISSPGIWTQQNRKYRLGDKGAPELKKMLGSKEDGGDLCSTEEIKKGVRTAEEKSEKIFYFFIKSHAYA